MDAHNSSIGPTNNAKLYEDRSIFLAIYGPSSPGPQSVIHKDIGNMTPTCQMAGHHASDNTRLPVVYIIT